MWETSESRDPVRSTATEQFGRSDHRRRREGARRSMSADISMLRPAVPTADERQVVLDRALFAGIVRLLAERIEYDKPDFSLSKDDGVRLNVRLLLALSDLLLEKQK
jgi:hypothetical protein